MTPANRYAAATKVARLLGNNDFNDWLTSPDKVPPPPPQQPDPMVMAQLQLAQGELQVKQMEAQAKVQKQQNDFELEKARLQLQMQQFGMKQDATQAETQRKWFVSASNVDVEQRDMAVVEAQPAAEHVTAIATAHPSS